MKTVLLLGLNARYSHSNPALYYLRQYCRALPFVIEILERSINAAADDILKEIDGRRPDVLGISVYIWNAALVKLLLPGIKKSNPRCTIVLGGPEVSINAEAWIRQFDEIDAIITGAGEHSFRRWLKNNAPGEKIVSGDNPHFSEIPFPYMDSDFEGFKNRYIYYEASRGCPLRCSYCLSSRSEVPLQFRNIDLVKNELVYLMRKKPDTIKFVDRTFNADPGFAREIWRFLMNHHCSTRFHFEIHPARLGKADFSLLAGLPPDYFQFEIGIQSTNERTLKEINRTGSFDGISEKVRRLIGLRSIRIHLDMIAGLPFEDIESIEKTFNDIYSLHGDYFQPGFLKVLPGTGMDSKKEEYGIRHDSGPPYRIRSNRWLSAEAFDELDGIEGLVNGLYNSGKFVSTLDLIESLYPSPFGLYRSLSRWWVKHGLDHHRRERLYLSSGITEFIEDAFPELADEVRQRLSADSI